MILNQLSRNSTNCCRIIQNHINTNWLFTEIKKSNTPLFLSNFLSSRKYSRFGRAGATGKISNTRKTNAYKSSKNSDAKKTNAYKSFKTSKPFENRRTNNNSFNQKPNDSTERYDNLKEIKKKYSDMKKKKVPGIGYTPARFQLFPIENQSKTELLSILRRGGKGANKTLKMSEVKELLDSARFEDMKLEPIVLEAARDFIKDKTVSSSKLKKSIYFPGIKETTSEQTNSQEMFKPTPIQVLAIPEILRLGKNAHKISNQTQKPLIPKDENKSKTILEPSNTANALFLAAETGSGKTLAYLLPIISLLKKQESELIKSSNGSNEVTENNSTTHSESNSDFLKLEPESDNLENVTDKLFKERRPRAVIVVPTKELAQQIVQVCKKLSHTAKISSMLIDFKMGLKNIQKRFDSSVIDIVVGTPSSLRRAFYKGNILSYANVQYVVIDEADTIMDDQGHLEDTCTILKQLRLSLCSQNKENQESVLFVSATLPKTVLERIVELYPKVTNITTPSLHQVNPKIKINKIDVNKEFQGSKINALKEVLNESTRNKKIIVFCNTVMSAVNVYSKLYENKYPVLLLTGNLKNQPGNQETFKNRSSDHDSNKDVKIDTKKQKSKNQELDIVSLHLGSRGIDTINVDHVVMFDFPTTAINYLHRCGRTGRVGTSGRVTTLIGKNDRRNSQKIDLFVKSGVVAGYGLSLLSKRLFNYEPKKHSANNRSHKLTFEDDQYVYEIVVVYECQRGIPGIGRKNYGIKLLLISDPAAWSDITMSKSVAPIDYQELTDGWEWVSPRWMVHVSSSTDYNGWSYATRFGSKKWAGNQDNLIAFARRRKWIRVKRKPKNIEQSDDETEYFENPLFIQNPQGKGFESYKVGGFSSGDSNKTTRTLNPENVLKIET
ncbi:hypothetical protein BB559_005688 [Furculomyces boomerangus]|uniref:RNA helicase n=1 Tax=Furculomyces boomerangus TaxID=61424 RepID=A0A2T9Y7B6_9FUNG|nr:hypothetical protein BB559_005688 [Furculomyces boomerangus]